MNDPTYKYAGCIPFRSILDPDFCLQGQFHDQKPKLSTMDSLEAIKYDGKRLQVLNQLLLPGKTQYEDIKSVEDAWDSIKSMKVRTEGCIIA